MSLTLLLSSRTRFSLVNAPPPSAAFILKVFEFYFLFWSYFPPFFCRRFLFCFSTVLVITFCVGGGGCFIIASFARGETGTHRRVCFRNSALVPPQLPDTFLPPSSPKLCP